MSPIIKPPKSGLDIDIVIGEIAYRSQEYTFFPLLGLGAIRFGNDAQESTFQKEWRPKIYLSEVYMGRIMFAPVQDQIIHVAACRCFFLAPNQSMRLILIRAHY
jgi:hypothetical protein